MAIRKRKLAALSQPFEPLPMEYETTEERLTASAGLGPILDLFLDDPLFSELCACLPQRRSNASYDTEKFAIILFAGFLKGYDCLEDLDQFHNDPLLLEKLGELPTSKAIGDWLRDFDSAQIVKLQFFLKLQAQTARLQINPKAPLVIDIDSTSHVQHGTKMEGLGYDYDSNWCLSSLMCSDDLLFAHAFELRPGNTFSCVNSATMIGSVFSDLKHSEKKYARADSAFCNQEFVEECIRKGAKFTVTAHGNTLWETKVPLITEWKPWVHTEDELKIFAEKKISPPVIELGSFLYQPGWSENLRFYIVVKRTWRKDHATGEERWFHYGVLTNWNLFENSLQDAIAFHHKRGHSGENSIKEFKYAFDLLHFPCQRMSANTVYGLFALIAHNHLRTIALLDNRENPLYARRLRFKLINQPGKIISHSRKIIGKFSNALMKEVKSTITAWTATRITVFLARAG
jgi:hypothetical protein